MTAITGRPATQAEDLEKLRRDYAEAIAEQKRHGKFGGDRHSHGVPYSVILQWVSVILSTFISGLMLIFINKFWDVSQNTISLTATFMEFRSEVMSRFDSVEQRQARQESDTKAIREDQVQRLKEANAVPRQH